ncbi:type II CAAX prenyl endopeptidase Rce1 family protein [Marinimicrobium sp. ABcell2]|uniref:CPBP family glutamic-type intramembrane protease n=1 Tax=Marinimicrobium sp. ABcell2 TaxID=3069751 RepID=UPI0027ADFBB7|nr:CPBP family glutamic-type intramembrane protease [Marinimicrobium sp. ABcell2]MDQ2076775.1 CPBP family glutamic-type intramembrane protease [Marinimicrobium sp. ABcell2]
MFAKLKRYVVENLFKGLLVPPWRAPREAWLPVPVFVVVALALAIGTGLFQLDVISSPLAPLLFVGLLFTPSLVEEALFRGLLIPRHIRDRGPLWVALAIGGSTILYVLWHPLSALTNRPEAQALFLDPVFLTIVALLGITCGYSYVYSSSLWVPTLIHWATVVAWVFLLGGHHLVLD